MYVIPKVSIKNESEATREVFQDSRDKPDRVEPLRVSAQKIEIIRPVQAAEPTIDTASQTVTSGSGSDVVSYIMETFGDIDGHTAVAVAKAESSLNCGAIGDRSLNPKSYGLFQIRAFKGRAPVEHLLDCKKNIQEAKKLKDTQGWRIWSAYTSGKYKKFL